MQNKDESAPALQNAEVIVSEIEVDLSRFESAGHLAAWAGVASGNNESVGKRRSGKTRRGTIEIS
jgi:transposase